jgi:hypothetical protein
LYAPALNLDDSVPFWAYLTDPVTLPQSLPFVRERIPGVGEFFRGTEPTVQLRDLNSLGVPKGGGATGKRYLSVEAGYLRSFYSEQPRLPGGVPRASWRILPPTPRNSGQGAAVLVEWRIFRR